MAVTWRWILLGRDIVLIDSVSGDRQQLTFSEAFDFSPVWSPDSDRFAYTSENVRSTIDVESVSERGRD